MRVALLSSASLVVALVLLLGVALLLLLAVLRLTRESLERRRTAHRAVVRDLLLAALMGEPDEALLARGDLVRRHGRSWSSAERQAFGMLPKITGTSRVALVRVLRDKGAASRAVGKTSSWSLARRCQGAYELGALGTRDAVPVLLPMLDDRSLLVRRVTVRALGAIGDPGTVTPLLQVAGEEPRLTNDLLFALDRMGTSAAPLLRQELERSLTQRGGGGRHADLAAVGLGLIRDLTGVDVLVRAVREGRAGLQVAAVRALGAIGAPAGVTCLVEALDADDEGVRLAAAVALGEVAADHASRALARWLESDQHELGRRAAESLVQIPSGREVLRRSGSPYAREALALASLRPGS